MLQRELQNLIDPIEDDAQFILAEHDYIIDYCIARKWELSDEDLKTIASRGYDFENDLKYYYAEEALA